MEQTGTSRRGYRWTDEELCALLRERDSGLSAVSLAGMHGLSRQRIHVLLRRAERLQHRELVGAAYCMKCGTSLRTEGAEDEPVS